VRGEEKKGRKELRGKGGGEKTFVMPDWREKERGGGVCGPGEKRRRKKGTPEKERRKKVADHALFEKEKWRKLVP